MRALRSPASASTRTGCGGCWRRWSAAISTTPARSRRARLGPRGWGGEAAADPLGLPRRPACGLRRDGARRRRLGRVHRPARARRGRRPSARGPRRWSCRAPSRRPSGWSRSRPPPAGRCRSRRATRGCSRSRASCRRRCPGRSDALTSFPVEAGAVEAIAARLERLAGASRSRAGGGPGGPGRDRRAGSGAGRAWPAACSPPPPATRRCRATELQCGASPGPQSLPPPLQ